MSPTMTIKPIVLLPDPVLRKVSQPLETVDDAARKLADDMLDTIFIHPALSEVAKDAVLSARDSFN